MSITQYSIKRYLTETYGGGAVLIQSQTLENFKPLLQKDYGEDNDCTLTSMTAIINYYTNETHKVQDIYNVVEPIAKKYLYRGTKGTPFITIRKIFQEALKKYKLPNAYVKYAKDIGFKFSNIQAEINKGNPVILSMLNDGRDYYENHSITIVGYEIYKKGSTVIPMLKIYDNWSTNYRYIDYNKLSPVCSIHYSGITFKQKFQMWRQLKNLK